VSRFTLGRLLATPGALVALNGASFWPYIKRHANGDWGDISADDQAENELSLKHGFRLFSVYALPEGGCIWIITEADRSATTILTPEEY
jgi:hypothetical protein